MKPLSRKLRRTTFALLILIFIVGTPILIGYSVGYRLDDALSLIQTGGIYLHSDVSNTTVYLDGDFVENNGAFLKNTLIQDLTPVRTYEVWVVKEGYQSWIKELPVTANLVTESSVLMLPVLFDWQIIEATTTLAVADTLPRSTTTKTVANPEFVDLDEYFLADKDQFAIEVATSTYVYVRGKRTATTTIITEYQFPEWLSEVASTSALVDKNMVREREGIISWLDQGNIVAVWARDEDPIPYYFCMDVCKKELIIDWNEPITRFEFYPNRNDVVILSTERGIYAVELDSRSQRNIQPILETSGLDFRLRGDGSLIVFDGLMYRETSF